MNKAIKTIVCGVAAMFALTVTATAPSSATQFTPKLMNYQGYLADPSTGTVYYDGIYHIECRLYREASGGTAIWGGKYSVYVKDGYFNIMLGDSAAENLGYTYANVDIWRALWSDTSVTSSKRNDLWLGITVCENYRNGTIASPTEIAPRQQLLTAPYAFRAQSAEYANQSYGNFRVNGTLTASSLSLTGNNALDYITANATPSLMLGGTSIPQNPNDLPYLYAYGRYMYIYPYNDMYITPQQGNITINIPSGKKLRVNNNNFEVSNAQTALASSGSTSVSAGSTLTMTATSDVTVKSTGSSADVKVTAGRNVYLEPASGKNVYGSGKVQWGPDGKTTSYGVMSPFIVKTVNVTISSDNFWGNAVIDSNTTEYSNYKWMIVGVSSGNALSETLPGLNEFKTYERSSDATPHWYVRLDRAGGYSSSVTYVVTCLGIHKSFLNN